MNAKTLSTTLRRKVQREVGNYLFAVSPRAFQTHYIDYKVTVTPPALLIGVSMLFLGGLLTSLFAAALGAPDSLPLTNPVSWPFAAGVLALLLSVPTHIGLWAYGVYRRSRFRVQSPVVIG